MKVESFCINNFRNIKSMELYPCETSNVIYGDNAQGKTNLIEALWLFSGSKSFRGSKDSEFISFNEISSKLDLSFFAKGRNQNSQILFKEDKKTVLLNEIKQESVTKLAGEFCAVIFSPDHLSLIKQGPDKRRKLIDSSLIQAYPKYMRFLEGYNRALKQRNMLLKDIPHHSELIDTLEIWNESLLDYGAYITSMRARYVKKLALLAAEIYNGISGGKEKFSASYAPGYNENFILTDAHDRDKIRDQFAEALDSSRSEDIKQGITTLGPHRDDIDITLDGVSARSFGSQGQQRSSILALKLAECGILEERNSEPPVILLDDVMSELDHSRRDFLLNRLCGKQVFITCCDVESFKNLNGGKVFKIKDGARI